jgi:hypothetical protein
MSVVGVWTAGDKIYAMSWSNGHYLEWDRDGALVVEINPPASPITRAFCDVMRNQTLDKTKFGYRIPAASIYDLKYRDVADAPGKPSGKPGVFHNSKKHARVNAAIFALLPLPIAEEICAVMPFGMTVEQWREDAARRYPPEVPAYYRR